jgi:hypothetical protein
MPGLDHFDALERPAIAVASDRYPFEGRVAVTLLGGLRHRTGGLARRKHDQPPSGRLRQQGPEAACRMGGRDGGIEQAAQKIA